MSRRRTVLLTLLGLGIAGLVLLSSALPGLVFRYQDGQAQGQTPFAEEESLTLTLNQASGVSLQDKLTILREMSFTSISLQEKMMTHSSQEAVELCSAGLSEIYNNFGFDLWHTAEDTKTEANCLGYLQESDGTSFRVWYVMFYRKSGVSCSLTLDDETGLILSIFCKEDGLCASLADRWVDDERIDTEAQKQNLLMASDLAAQMMSIYCDRMLRQVMDVSAWDLWSENTDYDYQATYQVLESDQVNPSEVPEEVYDGVIYDAEPEQPYAVEPAGDCYVTVQMGPDSWGINVG